MTTNKRFRLLAASLLLATGLAACDSKPGPAESAGRKIDQSANDAGKAISAGVDKVGDRMKEQGAATAVAIDDTEITTRVKAAIFAEPGLKTLQIGVATIRGVVSLTGSVDSQLNSETAKSLAAAVAGVVAVDNKLVIKP